MNAGKFGLGISICVAAGILMPVAAQAQNTFRLYTGVAPTSYSISFDNNAPNGYRNKTAKSKYTAANVGFSWISPKGIYVDVSGQESLSAHHDLWTDETSQEQKFSRDTFTLTGGYSHTFGQGVSVSGFGGYTQGTTTLNAPKGATTPFTINFSKDIFQSKGIFVGVGTGMPALGGQISGSAAIAFMNGRWKDDNTYNNHADVTLGYSLSVAYTYKFTPAWGITGDIRGQRYNFDFATSSAATAYQVSEKIVSAGVRLSYQF
jgi:hypothetical protein